MHSVDLAIIGTGEAGTSAAHACRDAGWEVVVVDVRPFGGTCALRGCDPKKVLVAAEELVDWAQRFRAKGVVDGDLRINWPALIRFKTTFTESVPEQRASGFAAAGILTLRGRAEFIDATSLRVGDTTLQARYILIASGAKPLTLRIAGEEYLTTSEQFLDLEELPSKLVMVGGGYVSFEFAHVAARAGAHVTILHQGARPLEQFDPDLVDQLVAVTRALGIQVRLNTAVRGVERSESGLLVHTAANGAELSTIPAEIAVHGAGRVADVEDLELDKGNVARTKDGIAVNAYLQSTSNPNVYAAGDAADSHFPRLTPVASAEGEIVATNLLHGNHREARFEEVPSIVYTTPALASVGISESAARTRGVAFRTSRGDSSGWYSTRRVAAQRSAYKVLIEEGSDRILGAHVLGPSAEELINLFAVAIRFGLPAHQLQDVIFAYPTAASDLASMV